MIKYRHRSEIIWQLPGQEAGMAENLLTGEFITFIPRGGLPVSIVRYGGIYVRVTRYGGKQVTYVPYGGTPITIDREAELPEDVKEQIGY
jgi:hypothetical protein